MLTKSLCHICCKPACSRGAGEEGFGCGFGGDKGGVACTARGGGFFHSLPQVSTASWCPQGHLSEGYGQLCSIYLKLLRTKMEFHTKVSTVLSLSPQLQQGVGDRALG